MKEVQITSTHVTLLNYGLQFAYEPVNGRAGKTGRFAMMVPKLDAEGEPIGSIVAACVGYVGLRKRALGFAAHATKLKDWEPDLVLG